MKKLIRFLIPVLIFAVGGAGFAYLRASRPPATPVTPTEQSWVVATEEVVIASHSPMVGLHGSVESPLHSKMASAISAEVIEVIALPGINVVKGDPLILLDRGDLELVLDQRKADLIDVEAQIRSEYRRQKSDLEALSHENTLLEIAIREVARAERLKEQNLGAASKVDSARMALEQRELSLNMRRQAIEDHESRLAKLMASKKRTEAARSRAQRDLNHTVIKAPFSGRITRVMTAIGNRVGPGEPLLELFDNQQLEVRAQIPTRLLSGLKKAIAEKRKLIAMGQPDGHQIIFRLDRLAAQVERGTGGVDGFFKVESGDSTSLELGRTLSLLLTLPPVKSTFTVPVQAIYGNNRLYRLIDNRMRASRILRIGNAGGREGRVIVQSEEVADGDTIIVSNIPNAVEGLQVKPGTHLTLSLSPD